MAAMKYTRKSATDSGIPGLSRARSRHSGSRKRGRPSTYTPDLGRRICKLVAWGTPLGTACRFEGVGLSTVKDWRARGRAGVDPYAEFVLDLEKAFAEVEVQLTVNLVAASKRDWRAAAWWLERRRPKMFGAKQELRIEHKEPKDMTDAELEAALGVEIEKMGYVKLEHMKEPQ